MTIADATMPLHVPRLRRAAGIAALAGMGVACLAAFLDPVQACRSYLVAAVFVVGFPVGALGLTMIHALTGGEWGEQLAFGLRATLRTMPLSLVLFAPVLVMIPAIYPWAMPEPHVHFREEYLNVPFFIG